MFYPAAETIDNSEELVLKILNSSYDRRKQKRLEEVAKKPAARRLILSEIYHYFKVRGLRWPTAEQALQWAHTESGEVAEQLLAQQPGWIRNNPENKDEYSEEKFLEEISDQVLMLLVAGMVMGYDILEVMHDKMNRKLDELT